MKHALFCFCLIASVCLTAGGEFKNLLAVNSLEGWESIGKAKWTVNKGILIGSQDGDAKRWGYLQTKRKYKNFELRLDFKIDEHGKYNSGRLVEEQPEGWTLDYTPIPTSRKFT